MVKKTATRAKSTIWPVLIATAVVCLGTLFLLLCLAAMLLCRVDLPHSVYGWITIGVCAASCLLGGMVPARMTGENGMLRGALVGLGLFVVVSLLGLAQGRMELTAFAFIRLLILVVCGAAGGYLGILQKERKRKLHG